MRGLTPATRGGARSSAACDPGIPPHPGAAPSSPGHGAPRPGVRPHPDTLLGTGALASPRPGAAQRPWSARPCPRRPPLARPPLPARIRGLARSAPGAARSAPARLRYLLAARSAARARLGPGVCAARSRRVSAALRERCFGAARHILGATRSVLTRVTCSSTPRLACLPLATRLPLPVYFMRIGHVVHINEMETQLRN
jgi:hypothetical protein